MNFITKTLNKLFKSTNQQELNKIKPIVVKINELEKDFLNFSEQKDENELLHKYHQMRKDYILKNKFFSNKDTVDFHEFFINCEGSVPKNFFITLVLVTPISFITLSCKSLAIIILSPIFAVHESLISII